MKKQIPNILFAGGMLLVMASALMHKTVVAPFILIVGTLTLVFFHYITATRASLRRYFLPVLFFIAAVYFMFKGQNSWILMLFIAAILELYYAFRTEK
ncbi:MAG: hypothetical protein LBR75_05600 [Prevotellaceae bacterium]|jgi:drug/metabolite transporter (DMT)-like permease|nr:hypothetical protein [Prevotellaceae bacterium]